MNRTVLILNLLVSSMSMARPIDVTTNNEDENYTIDDPTPRIADETEYDVIPLARKDDVITTSELSKVYTSEENKFAKTRSLKDETENNRFRKVDLNPVSRVANSKSGEKLANKPQEKSDNNEKQVEIETKAAKREERKSTERNFPVAKVENIFKAGKKEEKSGSNAEVVKENKSGKKEQSEVEERSSFNAEDVEETKAGEKDQSEVEERSSSNAEDVEETKAGEKDQSEVEERSGSNAEVVEETKAGKKQQSKVEERSGTTAKTDVESKDAMKEESRIEKDTSELIGLERTTETVRREVKSADNLENDDDNINDKVASDENSERIGYEVPVNDETNSAWDALDDIPLSRRMLSLPANLNIELKSKAGSENVDPLVARIVPEIKIASRNHIAYGPPNIPVIPIPQLWSTISLPHIHPAILPARRFIVPGIVKIRPAPPNTPINDFRRLQSQETNNIISQNTQPVSDYRYGSDNAMNQNQNGAVDNDERSQKPPKFRDVPEDYNTKEDSNAYPYTPPYEDLKTPKMTQTSTANPLFAKLVEASGHPQRFNPNRNGNNLQNIQTVPFNNYARPNTNFNNENMHNYPGAPNPKNVRPNTYAAPQSIYKYVPGFGRLR